MNTRQWNWAKCIARFSIAVALIIGISVPRQLSADETPKPQVASSPAAEDYKIGADDVLVISVVDAPEFGGRFRVSDSGVIDIPGLAAPVQAQGQSSAELSHSIRQALIDAKQLRDPRVTVFVEEYHGRTITVLGAVAKPSVYPLARRTNILEALSLAGGTLPNSGNTVTIVRGPASAEAANLPVGSVQVLRMNDLVSGKDLSANLEVKNGDVISVSAAQIVYVVGAVVKPGGYAMSDPASGVSVVQAVALAEGLKQVASHHALVVRQSTSDRSRVEIPVDLGLMMTGKTTDVTLAPNDILYVPTSGTKLTLKALGEAALVTASGIAVYGFGYRIGNH